MISRHYSIVFRLFNPENHQFCTEAIKIHNIFENHGITSTNHKSSDKNHQKFIKNTFSTLFGIFNDSCILQLPWLTLKCNQSENTTRFQIMIISTKKSLILTSNSENFLLSPPPPPFGRLETPSLRRSTTGDYITSGKHVIL